METFLYICIWAGLNGNMVKYKVSYGIAPQYSIWITLEFQ